MIIVLKQDAPDVQVREFCHELEDMGLQINDSKGSDTHILGLIGDTKAIAESWVLANPVVETCRRVSEPYKKANRKFHPDDSVIDVEGVKIGGGNFAVIAGPCSIESEEQITYCAQRKLLHIAGDDKPAEVVRSRFMKLNADHIRFVLKCLAENSSPIRNMKQYLLASLYNAPTTMQLSYQNQTNHDLANRR